MYLPPVTPAQAHAVYRLLHVTGASIELDRIYREIYFSSTFAHIVIRFLFLALGLSRTVRDQSQKAAEKLKSLALVDRLLRLCQLISRTILKAFPGVSSFGQKIAEARWTGVIRYYINAWKPVPFRAAFIYVVYYTAIFTIFWLPLNYYAGFVLPHEFGLSHQPLVGWAGDVCKDTAVDTFGDALAISLLLWVIDLYPKKWALVLALWSAPLILVGTFLDPVFDQIDNSFTPLPTSSALYAPLHHLASSAGVPKVTILVADKSKQTEETNAYVTGVGSSSQIVLWDTTIRRMKPDEVVAVTAHEMGHYVEHHVVIGGFAAAAGMFVYLPILKMLADRFLARFGERWQIRSLTDPAAIPLLIVLSGAMDFTASPVVNAVSRVIEHRADSFGLALTRDRLAMARAQVDLANEDEEDPYQSRWEVFWLDNHPPASERIHFALYGQPMTLPPGVHSLK